MAYIIRLTPSAIKDIKVAKEWYNDQKAGLGNIFIAYFRERIESLQNTQVVYQKIYREVSALKMKKFPFTIYGIYNLPEQTIDIIAVLHNKQNVLKELQLRINK
jgi:toxin ParE1/3/4